MYKMGVISRAKLELGQSVEKYSINDIQAPVGELY